MNDAPDQAVIASLVQVLATRIHEWYGHGATLISTSFTFRKFPYSFFIGLTIKTSTGEQTLLVKIHRKPHIHTLAEALTSELLRKLARNEYEISQLIWRAFEEEHSPDCEVVQYLAFLEDWNALLMRQVKGKMLKEYLLRPSIAARRPRSMKRLLAYLALSARWLRIFHSRVSGLQAAPFPAVEAGQRMQDILTELQAHSNDQVDIMAYRKALGHMLEDLRSETMPIGLLHADFHFSNILITSEGSVCALDYSLNHHGPIHADLATILIDPETRKAQILTGGRFLATSFLQTCKKTILDEYFKGEPYSESVLNFYCALAILNKWSADESEFSMHATLMNRTLVQMTRRYYAAVLQHYLNLSLNLNCCKIQ